MKKRGIIISIILIVIIVILLMTNFISSAETPSSLKKLSYNSKTLNTTRLMNVYLPAGYSSGINYPVLYLLHGGGGNQDEWTSSGNAKSILDSAISNGKAVPMIVVMPDCGGQAQTEATFTKLLMDDIIPYVESNFQVRTDKDSRALAGLSWGGLQTLDAGLYNYQKFSYLGVFSSGWFTSDSAKYSTMRSYLNTNGAAIEQSIKYFYYGDGGSSDIAYQNGLATMELLRNGGINIDYKQHSGGHSYTCWNQDLEAFIPKIFEKNTSVSPSLSPSNSLATTTSTNTLTPSSSKTPEVTTSNNTSNEVDYKIVNDWGNGATINVSIINSTNQLISGWKLEWSFTGNQKIGSLWNGKYTQSGNSIVVENDVYNSNIQPKSAVSFGFNISYSGTNDKPTSFKLNGVNCSIR